MNLPNQLTLLRIFLVPIFVFFLLYDSIPNRFGYALVIFLAASASDFLDGHIARKYNLITNFGKLMDPLADKIIVMSAFICFVKLNLISVVNVIIILFREFAITSIRLLAVEQGKVIPANIWGKLKTVSQMCTIVYILTILTLDEAIDFTSTSNSWMILVASWLSDLSVILTIISGVIYVKDSADLFKDM